MSSQHDKDHTPVPDSVVSQVLGLVSSGSTTPVDELLSELTRDTGEAWLRDALRSAPITPLSFDGPPQFPVGREAATELKRRSKSHHTRSAEPDARARAAFGYLLATSIVLVEDGESISGWPLESLRRVLADVTESVPEEWRGFFADALRALPEASED